MTRSDAVYPPGRITLREVGLRDGLQLVTNYPSTAAKTDWIRIEASAGVRHFEVGSFLPASRFPQFSDVADLVAVAQNLGVHSAALTLNERGAEAALGTAVRELVCVVSATEEHSQANMRRSRVEAIELVRTVAAMRDAQAPGKLVNVGISMAFGCSIAGEVSPDEVMRLTDACLEAGADIVGLADTVGYAGPKAVGALSARLERLCRGSAFIIHLHDTRGLGLANAAAAIDNGARVVDASLGGLGGCPFAPGASGNIVFEDAVFLAESMGFDTGIDLDRLGQAREIAEASMPGETFQGALNRAGPPKNTKWQAGSAA